METVSELSTLIFKLLPGFVTAWVFAGLTAYKIKGPFARIAQALVFTVFAQAATILIEQVAILVGQWKSFGPWTENSTLFCSIFVAVLIGVVFAFAANRSLIHDKLWKWGVTNGSSYPSNWYKTFVCEKRWLVLHLKDGRRITGWAVDWPDQNDSDFFVLTEIAWLSAKRPPLDVPQTDRILIPAKNVDMVELLKDSEEEENRTEEKDCPVPVD